VISGTDYNIDSDLKSDKKNLRQTFKHFRKFKTSNNSNNFYDWLSKNTDYISDSDIDLLHNINKLFCLDITPTKLCAFNNIKIINCSIKQEEVENIMKEEDFIFCK
jgi:hypothetical protein